MYGTAKNNRYCNGLNEWNYATLNGTLVKSTWSIETANFNPYDVATLFNAPSGYTYNSDNASYLIYNSTKGIWFKYSDGSYPAFSQANITFKWLVQTYPSLISYGDTIYLKAAWKAAS